MKRIKRYFESIKTNTSFWVDGICNELDELGYSYNKKEIKKYYKNIKTKSEYIPGITIKKELELLKKSNIVKPNLKKILNNNKKKCSALTFELYKNKHLLLLNGSMLDLSYKECEEILEKRKNKDYHFDYLLEDLNLQLFYEDRKIQELDERIDLLHCRISILESIIEIKRETNSIIDNFMEGFHKATGSKDVMYQYEIEASNIINEKKYSDEDINNDNEELTSSTVEKDEIIASKKNSLNNIEELKEQINRVESIVDLELDRIDNNTKKQSLKI